VGFGLGTLPLVTNVACYEENAFGSLGEAILTFDLSSADISAEDWSASTVDLLEAGKTTCT